MKKISKKFLAILGISVLLNLIVTNTIINSITKNQKEVEVTTNTQQEVETTTEVVENEYSEEVEVTTNTQQEVETTTEVVENEYSPTSLPDMNQKDKTIEERMNRLINEGKGGCYTYNVRNVIRYDAVGLVQGVHYKSGGVDYEMLGRPLIDTAEALTNGILGNAGLGWGTYLIHVNGSVVIIDENITILDKNTILYEIRVEDPNKVAIYDKMDKDTLKAWFALASQALYEEIINDVGDFNVYVDFLNMDNDDALLIEFVNGFHCATDFMQ